MTLKRFEDIKAWQVAKELVIEVYAATSNGEFSRDYRFQRQIRDAAVSGMSNIAEGFERGSDREFIQFLVVARASLAEVRSQLYVAQALHYISGDEFTALSAKASEAGKLINGFIGYLRNHGLYRRTSQQTNSLAKPFVGKKRPSKRLSTD